MYGYCFYPVWTLGIEQLYRVVEAAISRKCRDLGAPKSKKDLIDKVDWLGHKGVISNTEKEKLHNLRRLRNLASHPESQTMLPPGLVISLLRDGAQLIRSLFTPDEKNT